MTLSAYEQKEWDRLQRRKEDALGKQTRQLIPQQARERLAALGEKAKNVPGADKVTAAYNGAARGVGKAVGDTASRTVSKKRVIAQYQRAGHEITELDEIRSLDLRVVDAVTKQNLVRYGHALSAAATGLTSGAVVTGGELLAGAGSVAGAGVAAAPGIGTVAGAMAADATLMLGLSTRTVSSTALCYGYDPRDPEEEVFVMSVIALGLSVGTSAKVAAYSELSQLTQMLVRNVPWTKLNEKVLVKIAQRFAEKFGHHLVKRKLGQFVPVAGMIVGASLSYKLIDEIAVAARDAYRERFLVEKSGGDLTIDLDFDPARDAEDDDQEIRVIQLLREEDALPTSSPSSDDEDESLA
ncbi:EcsC family protein [Streptomyces sp. NPDC002734]|uniref:EcsC family protein n=1 Tax=Streptomyces sp. NPDC002734 TaxID=3154426 RepID=UPI00332C814E